MTICKNLLLAAVLVSALAIGAPTAVFAQSKRSRSWRTSRSPKTFRPRKAQRPRKGEVTAQVPPIVGAKSSQHSLTAI